SFAIRPAVAIILGSVAVISACGGDDAPAKTATSAATQQAAATANTSVAAKAASAAATTAAANATTAAAPAIDGTWTGTWKSGATSDNGTVKIDWKQSGQQLAGTIVVSNTPCVGNGTITGTVTGATIAFGAVQGATTIAYTGTVSGKAISGTYKADASCGNATGTWSATKS
ncbi:MAG: hypothetical protein ABIQ47_04775, partial [Tepidiformaceae bacterium]